jgi:hypothetical protein
MILLAGPALVSELLCLSDTWSQLGCRTAPVARVHPSDPGTGLPPRHFRICVTVVIAKINRTRQRRQRQRLADQLLDSRYDPRRSFPDQDSDNSAGYDLAVRGRTAQSGPDGSRGNLPERQLPKVKRQHRDPSPATYLRHRRSRCQPHLRSSDEGHQ